MHTLWITLGIILWIMVGLWPAMWAKNKGHSFILYFLLSIILTWFITLIIVAFLRDKTRTVRQQPPSQPTVDQPPSEPTSSLGV